MKFIKYQKFYKIRAWFLEVFISHRFPYFYECYKKNSKYSRRFFFMLRTFLLYFLLYLVYSNIKIKSTCKLRILKYLRIFFYCERKGNNLPRFFFNVQLFYSPSFNIFTVYVIRHTEIFQTGLSKIFLLLTRHSAHAHP